MILGAALTLLCSSSRALRAADAPKSEEAGQGSEDDSSQDDEALEVVISDGRRAENQNDTVGRVRVLTREEARRRGATNAGEALAGELDVEVNPSAYGSLGRPSAAQIGGLDRDRVLVMEDGERVVGDFGGAVDLAKVSLGGVSRIEIVSGPMSALYGTSAIGGVINVISAPPEIEGWSGRLQIE
jgi:outer membrane cobalamin receptor